MDRQVKRGKIGEAEKQAALKRISSGTGLEMFADSDIVIEAASENEEIKRAIFKTLCPQLKPSALICSNTSSISITRLAAVTDRPAKFMGLHFMNTVPLMHLVELIRGIGTDHPPIETVRPLSGKHGQTPNTA